jgi:DNA-binding transcriptional ArsR family regulator
MSNAAASARIDRESGWTEVSHPLSDDLVELIAARFRALSEPTRIRLLECLGEGESTVGALCERVGTSEQNVSKHLGVLRRAGLVRRRKRGNFAFYSVADAAVFDLCEHVCGSIRRQVELLGGAVASNPDLTRPE